MSLLKDEFEQFKEMLRRRQSKKGFNDISNWEIPQKEKKGTRRGQSPRHVEGG